MKRPGKPGPAGQRRDQNGAVVTDNRQVGRVPFTKAVLINGKVMLQSTDISEGGLYVHHGRSFVPGTVVDVQIPYDGDLKVRARVAHNQEGVGMGLMFVDLDSETRERLRELIRNIAAGDTAAAQAAKNKREETCVLLVEDDPATLRIYRSRLVLEGYSVVTAVDGAEAIRILNTRRPKIDLVVLDLYMEGMDGLKVLSLMKETRDLGDIPAVALTAKYTPQVMKRATERGAVACLSKMNTSPAKLAEIVKDILQKSCSGGAKRNCWEFLGCGKGPDRKNVSRPAAGGKDMPPEDGCPVPAESRLHGMHGGLNAGRACWAVLGTVCRGAVQDTYAAKCAACLRCPFYNAVKDEECKDFRDTLYLLSLLAGGSK